MNAIFISKTISFYETFFKTYAFLKHYLKNIIILTIFLFFLSELKVI